MTVFYSDIDRRAFLEAPQLQRSRSRYRGSRESYKMNLEMAQIAYDIANLYKKVQADQTSFGTDLGVINDSGTVVGTSVVGLSELLGRATVLESRVRALEMM